MTLQGAKLAVFAERVLRNLQQSPYVRCPDPLVKALQLSLDKLYVVLADESLKRKSRTYSIRAQSAPVREVLLSIALHIERTALVKSDINTTGFRPAAGQRRKAAVEMAG